MKKIIAAIIAASILSACTEGAIGFNESPAWHLTASEEAKAKYYGERCTALGLTASSPEHRSCVIEFWEGNANRPVTNTNVHVRNYAGPSYMRTDYMRSGFCTPNYATGGCL